MNSMTYKGYLGSVAYSEKDQVFFGKIEGINGLVNFEGESVKELTEAFHEAVDDYLAYCEDEGIEPLKNDYPPCAGKRGEFFLLLKNKQ